MYYDYKTKLLEKNNITTIISNNKKGKNKCYKKNIKNSLIKNNRNRIMNIFKQNNNNNYGILNRGVNSKYILEYNLSNTYNNYTKN